MSEISSAHGGKEIIKPITPDNSFYVVHLRPFVKLRELRESNEELN